MVKSNRMSQFVLGSVKEFTTIFLVVVVFYMEAIQVNGSIVILLGWDIISRVGNSKRRCYIFFITFISNNVSF